MLLSMAGKSIQMVHMSCMLEEQGYRSLGLEEQEAEVWRRGNPFLDRGRAYSFLVELRLGRALALHIHGRFQYSTKKIFDQDGYKRL